MAASAALSLGLSAASCTGRPAATVAIEGNAGELSVSVEVAATPEARRRGLMWRESLAETSGMLFVFDDDETRVFWMKNTPVPLDIIFISRDRRVVSVAHDTRPYSGEPIASAGPARYVLEVGAGLAARHGVARGSIVRLPPLAHPEHR